MPTQTRPKTARICKRPWTASAVAAAAAFVVLISMVPSVAAAEPSKPVRITFKAAVHTAHAGESAETAKPAKLNFAMNRALAVGERMSVPLSISGVAEGNLGLALKGSPTGVSLADGRLHLSAGARRASLLLYVTGDVTAGSFTVSVPRDSASGSAARSDDEVIWVNRRLAATGDLRVKHPRHRFDVKHPRAAPSTAATDSGPTADADDPVPQQAPPKAASETESVPGKVTVTGPTSDDGWAFPLEGRTDGTPFNYCAELDGEPVMPVVLSAAASPKLAAVSTANGGRLLFYPGAAPYQAVADPGWDRRCFDVHATAAAQNDIDELPRAVTFSHAADSLDARFGGVDVADHVVYVMDDDPTTVALSATDASASEGDSTATAALEVTLGRALQQAVPVGSGLDGELVRYDEHIEVPLRFAGGVRGDDFRLELVGAPSGVSLTGHRLRFAGVKGGSATSAMIKVIALDDADSVSEQLTVTIPSEHSNRPSLAASDAFAHVSHSVAANGGASLSGTAVLTITDDDPAAPPPPAPPTATFTTTWVGFRAESAGAQVVTVQLDAAAAADVVVNFKLSGTGDATLGADFTIAGASGTAPDLSVTVPAGETSASFTVTIVDDTVIDEMEHEDVRFDLAAGSGYSVGLNSFHRFIITDNEEVTSTSVSLFGFGRDEGKYALVTARLARALPHAVTIPVVVAAGTSEAGDHDTISAITIPKGDTVGWAEINTYVDADSDDETFTVSLGSPLPSGVTAGSSTSVTITITDTTG